MPVQMVLPTRDSFVQSLIALPTSVSNNELMAISAKNPGVRIERLGWKRIVMSPSGMESDQRSGLIYAQILAWADAEENGEAFGSNAGFQLKDGSVLSPDAAWVSNARLTGVPAEDLRGYAEICPEIIVEVVSPSDSLAELRKKCLRWRTEGAETVVLVNADKQQTEVFSSTEGDFTSTSNELQLPGFPGLVLKLERVWQGLRRKR